MAKRKTRSRDSEQCKLPPRRRREWVEGYVYDQTKADLVIEFIESLCVHTKDSPTAFAGEPIKLLDWHKHDLIEPLYGWHTPDGRRRYRTAYFSVPKKNAKSTALSCLSLWHLIMEGIGELGCIAAKNRKQAAIIYDETSEMVKRSDWLSSMIETKDSTKTLVCHSTRSSLSVISRDAGAAEGPSYSFVFCDELHAWPDRKLFDALKYSGRSRRSPILCTITTAGEMRESICWEQHKYAEQVIANPAYDPRFYGKIYAAKTDGTDDYFDPKVWRRVNPGMGITMTEEDFAADAREAKNQATKMNSFLRYGLGVWTSSDIRWVTPEQVDQCMGDHEAPIAGRDFWAGLDLASTFDTSAFVAWFPTGDGKFDVYAHAWIPGENAAKREHEDRVPYSQWARDGWLTITDGRSTDYGVIKRDIMAFCEAHRCRGLGIDRWNATMLAQELAGEGLPVVMFGQGFASMSSPTKFLEAQIVEGNLRFAGNKLLAWQLGNAAVQTDPSGNVKLSKSKSTERIDAAVALAMACGIHMGESQKPASLPEIAFW